MLEAEDLEEIDPEEVDENLLVRDPQKLQSLLQRTIDSRAIVSLTLPRVLRTLSSLLVGIDRNHQRLQLDAPANVLPPRPGSSIRSSARIDGARFEFVSDFLAADPVSWMLTLPQEALYLQRRTTYRLRVTRLPGVIGTHFYDHRQRFRGRLIDVSALGMCAQLSPGSNVVVGTLMECVIDLPDCNVSCRAEVRWHSRHSEGNQIGILFQETTPHQQQRLSLAIAALQRQLLRRHG